MAISAISTNLPGFVEIDQRRIINPFGQIEQIVSVYQGLDKNFAQFVPSQGTAHPNVPNAFLKNIDRSDVGGGLIQVTLVYVGSESVQQAPGGGINYSNLQTSVQLVAKSFSWQGVELVQGIKENISFAAQFTTLEVTYRYTAYNYPNGGQFRSNSKSFVQLVNAYETLYLTPANPALVYTGLPTLPSTINPQLVLNRFTATQAVPSSISSSGSPPTVTTNTAPWEVSETWSLEYNLGSLGIPTPSYTFS